MIPKVRRNRRLKMAPAPPVACSGLTFSSLVSLPTASGTGVCPSSLRHGNKPEQARCHHRISRPRLGQSPYDLAGARATADARGFGGAKAMSTMPMMSRAGTSPSRCPRWPTVSKASSPMMAP